MSKKTTQKITRPQAKKALSPTPNCIDLGTWGQFQTYPAPQNFKMPRLLKRGGEGRIHRLCDQCGRPFSTNREEQRFCKRGCRTYNNRKKRDGIARWMIDQGIPYNVALDTLEIKGMATLARQMQAMGLFWNGQAWEKKA